MLHINTHVQKCFSELYLISFLSSLPLPTQVMETKDMLYIVTEFAKNGEMFGKFSLQLTLQFPYPSATFLNILIIHILVKWGTLCYLGLISHGIPWAKPNFSYVLQTEFVEAVVLVHV